MFHVEHIQPSMLIIRIILKGGPTHAEGRLASLR